MKSEKTIRKPKEKMVDKWGKFTMIPNEIIEMWPVIGQDAFSVFVCLRYHTGNNESCWPSYKTIQAETTLSLKRICAALKTLEENTLLIKERRFAGSTVYTLTSPTLENRAASIAPAATMETPSSIAPLTIQYCTPYNTVLPQVQTNYTHSTTPIEQHPKENIAPKGAVAIENFSDDVLEVYTTIPAQTVVQIPAPTRQPQTIDWERTAADSKAITAGYKERLAATLINSALRHANQADLSMYPENLRPILQNFVTSFGVDHPGKRLNSDWLKSGTLLLEAVGEFGADLITLYAERYKEETQKTGYPPFTVSRPGSLIKPITAFAAEILRNGSLDRHSRVSQGYRTPIEFGNQNVK